MNEWKTMDTAPKDGTHILTCSPTHDVAETWWGKLLDWDREPFWIGNGWEYAKWIPPTHWMPCPNKPIFHE